MLFSIDTVCIKSPGNFGQNIRNKLQLTVPPLETGMQYDYFLPHDHITDYCSSPRTILQSTVPPPGPEYSVPFLPQRPDYSVLFLPQNHSIKYCSSPRTRLLCTVPPPGPHYIVLFLPQDQITVCCSSPRTRLLCTRTVPPQDKITVYGGPDYSVRFLP